MSARSSTGDRCPGDEPPRSELVSVRVLGGLGAGPADDHSTCAGRGTAPLIAETTADVIEQLRDTKARKRETAANKLCRKPDPAKAARPLFEAFQAELEDPRTWKAKAAQACTLARNPYPPAVDRLLEIAGDDLGGSAVNESVGSAAMGCGFDKPGPTQILRCLLGEDADVSTDRLAAVVGGLETLAEKDDWHLDEQVVERLLSIAEEDPPHTVPHGVHRRSRVFGLRHRLLDLAARPARPRTHPDLPHAQV